ncbi:MAG: hypothetical protein K8H86_14570, partial [Ignavibacteriaceae bacterium]|nr:hypothetical protein [Ignavibacteriaceae bacterium]
GLYLVIAVLVYLLVRVAIIEPKEIVSLERYAKKESRLRMENIKEAQILFQKKNGHFTASMDSLVSFLKNSPFVDSVRNGFDSLSKRPTDPFHKLEGGAFVPDSLFKTPKSFKPYLVQIDTSVVTDTIYTPQGKVKRVETRTVIGSRYYVEDPDGYGTVGSVESDALKNSLSWE